MADRTSVGGRSSARLRPNPSDGTLVAGRKAYPSSQDHPRPPFSLSLLRACFPLLTLAVLKGGGFGWTWPT